MKTIENFKNNIMQTFWTFDFYSRKGKFHPKTSPNMGLQLFLVFENEQKQKFWIFVVSTPRLRKFKKFVFARSRRLERVVSPYLGMFWDETFLFSCKNFKFKKFALYYFWSFLLFIFELSKFWTFKFLQVKGNVFIQNISKYELITLPSLRERAKNEFYCKLIIIGGLNSITVETAQHCFCWVLSGFSWFRSADPVEIPQSCIRSAASARLSPLKLDPHSTLFWIRSKLHPLSTNCIRSRLPRIRSRLQTGSASPCLKSKLIP